MCGLIGTINIDIHNYELKSILDKLKHRGPDDSGHFYFKNDSSSIFLGHNRLEILDINNGKQPMISSDGKYVVVYNGEIYNFKELRNKLESLGHIFVTDHSDTEILIHGYIEWGKKLPEYLNGMWSFGIYDKQRNTLFISRDRFGEKPLFYFLDQNKFIFSSELSGITQFKNIKFDLNKLNLKKYCAYGYFPFSTTPYNNIFKLSAGHNLFLDISKMKINIEKYWDYKIEPDYSIKEEEWKDKIFLLLQNSVKHRLVADVPVGVFLSGGLDSSIIAYLAQNISKEKINTFSINFDEKSFDESKYSNYLSKKINSLHHSELIDSNNIEKICLEYFTKIDEPISDSSLISYYLLCKFSQKKIKVALGGDAADELFAGYDTFKAIKYYKIMKTLKLSEKNPLIKFLVSRIPSNYSNMNFKFKIDRILRSEGKKLDVANPKWLSPMNSAEIDEIFGDKTSDEELYSEAIDLWKKNNYSNDIDKSLEFYTKIFLQDQILVKTDRLSMIHGLEVRSPFLDYKLVDCIRQIPAKFKLNKNIGKYILKKTFEKKLGKQFTYRKKMGFSAPISNWLMENSSTQNLKSKLLVDKQEIYNRKLNEHRKYLKENRIYLWNIMNLDNFLNKLGY